MFERSEFMTAPRKVRIEGMREANKSPGALFFGSVSFGHAKTNSSGTNLNSSAGLEGGGQDSRSKNRSLHRSQ